MNLFDKRLKRKDIASKLYDYRNNNKENKDDKTYTDGFLKVIEDYFSKSKFDSDKDFIMTGRKKFLFDEFYDYLDHKENHKFDNPIRFAIGNLEEFICNNNWVNFSDVDKSKWKDGNIIDGKDFAELRDINDRYSAKGYICLEEKEYIDKMMTRLNEEINDNSNTLKEIVDELVLKLKQLPSETEISITGLLGQDSLIKYTDDELTKICYNVFDICEKENIILDFSKYENQKVGLLYNIPFIKK